jgi:surfactin synthase thioesterase subunit
MASTDDDPQAVTHSARNPWLVCRRPRPDAAVRLYCFPHSGGSPGEYLRWADHLPDIEIWAVQAPGRGSRLAEPPYQRMSTLMDALLDAVEFDPPFVFFGHSLGALLAYETCRGLAARGRRAPRCLFVSAFPAPHLPRRAEAIHTLPDSDLLDVIHRRYGSIPDEVRSDPEYLDLILSTHRADLAVVETYHYVKAHPLGCPIIVAGGAQDDLTHAELDGWRTHTTAAFETHVLPGGHFYLREEQASLLKIINDAVGWYMAGAALRPARHGRPNL